MKLQVNLLPVHYRPKPSVRLWPILLTVVLMLNLIVLATYWVTLQVEIADARNEVNSLESELGILERRVAEQEWKMVLVENVAAKAAYIDSINEENILWVPLLAAFERAMVPGMSLTSFNTSQDGNVSMAGTTTSLAAVADFLGSLQAETGLPDIRFHQAAPEGTFQITFSGWTGRSLGETEGEDDE